MRGNWANSSFSQIQNSVIELYNLRLDLFSCSLLEAHPVYLIVCTVPPHPFPLKTTLHSTYLPFLDFSDTHMK